jgi:hypothetical protein
MAYPPSVERHAVVRAMAGPGFAQPYGPAQELHGNASARLQELLSVWLRADDHMSEPLFFATSLIRPEIGRDQIRLLLNANRLDCYNARDRVGGAQPQQ